MPPGFGDMRGLEEHRSFLQTVGKYLSGAKALHEDSNSVVLFELPHPEVFHYLPETQSREYGQVVRTERGYQTEDGRRIYSVGDVREKLEFLSELRMIVEEKRRDVAMQANREHSGQYVNPGGQKGHLLKEYDQLLDQIYHVHHRLRDKRSEQPES